MGSIFQAATTMLRFACGSVFSQFLSECQPLKIALELLHSAVPAIDRYAQPTDWGIFQHNLGYTYIRYFGAQPDPSAAIDLLDKAITHLGLSFEVRDPCDMLQYWVASCRSLAEALISGAAFRYTARAYLDLQRASRVLFDTKSKISEAEHPNQWGNLNEQESRLSDAIKRLDTSE